MGIFLLAAMSRPALGTTISFPVHTGGDIAGSNVTKCEADCSPPSGAEVENAWSFTDLPPLLHASSWCGA